MTINTGSKWLLSGAGLLAMAMGANGAAVAQDPAAGTGAVQSASPAPTPAATEASAKQKKRGSGPQSILPATQASDAAEDAPSGPATPADPVTEAVLPQGDNPRGMPEDSSAPLLSEPVMSWTEADAKALVTLVEGLGAEGLIPADYQPEALKAAIAAGDSNALDTLASRVFGWVIEDLRDGRAPMAARVQWFAVDPDREATPTAQVMAQALAAHDVAGVVAKLNPVHPDFAKLKAKLAAAARTDTAARGQILANMDRWRWLPRDLGKFYMYSNVPEFQVRLTVRKNNGSYWNWTSKTVVGKPGRTATPQLSETVTAVVFNPTWTVPQSIVKGEGLGAKVLNNPNWARNNGYKATKAADGNVYVVQQPGANNALGLMKIDMPNEHAIYFHDTPSKAAFNEDVRAYSHGCVRTEEAVQLGMLLGILGAGKTRDEVLAIHKSGEYTKVALTKPFPVYITYFTMASSVDNETSQFGPIRTFGDIYGRDKPVIESFAKPRERKTTQRKSDEEVIELDNPL